MENLNGEQAQNNDDVWGLEEGSVEGSVRLVSFFIVLLFIR